MSPQSSSAFGSLQSPADSNTRKKSKLKRKSEMCMYIARGDKCPFGNTCTYAHYPSDVKLTSFKSRIELGLIDNETYRNKPCFDFVATGSCPFGYRCNSIHDPAIKNESVEAWLPRIKNQNELPTDFHVDSKSTHTFSSVQHGSPFGNSTEEIFTSFNSFRRIMRQGNTPPIGFLSEFQRLTIALNMASSHKRSMKYSPSHKVLGRICMIAQVKAFKLIHGLAVETPSEACNFQDPSNMTVHELIFGHSLSEDELPPSLWFNLPMGDITECSHRDVLKYNRQKARNNDRISPRQFRRGSVDTINFRHLDQGLEMHHWTVEKAFILHFADDDEDLHNLILSSLQFDLAIMERQLSMHSDNNTNSSRTIDSALYRRGFELANEFTGFKHFFLKFSNWPKSDDWEVHPRGSMPIPEATREYRIHKESGKNYELWRSFVSTLNIDARSVLLPGTIKLRGEKANWEFESNLGRARLPMFQRVTDGESLSCRTKIPNIFREDPDKGSTSKWEKFFKEWGTIQDFYIKDKESSDVAARSGQMKFN